MEIITEIRNKFDEEDWPIWGFDEFSVLLDNIEAGRQPPHRGAGHEIADKAWELLDKIVVEVLERPKLVIRT